MLGGTREQIVERRLERVARRRRAAHLPARAEHGLAQELGGRRRDEPRRAARAVARCAARWAIRRRSPPRLGLSGRAVQRQADRARAPLELVRHGERAVQDLVPGGVPRADGGRGGVAAASRSSRNGSTTSREITIETQEAGVRIIDKTGPLANPADRDHCLQYMVAVPLIFGRLTADDYEDDVARDPRIDALRAKMVVTRERDVQPRLPRPRQARDRQRGAGVVRATARRTRAHRGGLSDRASPAPRGRHPEAGREVRARASRRASTRRSARAIDAACADQAALEALPVEDFMALWVEAMSQGRKFRAAVAKRAPLQIPGAINAYCALLARASRFRRRVSLGRGRRERVVRPAGSRRHGARGRARGCAPHHGRHGAAAARGRGHGLGQRIQHRAHRARDGARGRRRDAHRGPGAGEALRPSAEQGDGRRRGDVRSVEGGRRRAPRRGVRRSWRARTRSRARASRRRSTASPRMSRRAPT